MAKMTAGQFVLSLLREFPALREELDDESVKGLLHMEMGCFFRLTQQAIDDEDEATVKKCFQFADSVFHDADSDLTNALYVSYLEHLNFKDGRKRRQWAYSKLPAKLQAGFREINEYMDDVFRRGEKRKS